MVRDYRPKADLKQIAELRVRAFCVLCSVESKVEKPRVHSALALNPMQIIQM